MTHPNHDTTRKALTPAVTSLLATVRRRTHAYAVHQGVAVAVAWLAAAFWMTLVADWFFEPPIVVRIVMLAAVAGVLATIVIRLVVRRLAAPITDANAAMILERRFPTLNDSLLTAVTLGQRQPEVGLGGETEWNPAMFEQTCREAEKRIVGLDVGKLFNRRPLRKQRIVAAVTMASVLIFAAAAPQSVAVWFHRVIGMSTSLWPRYTHLSIVGFKPGKPLKVARGADVEITVFADAKKIVPSTVAVRYRADGGGRGTAAMDRHGAAGKSNDQEFVYTFHSVLSDVHFDVVGGDDRLSNLWIEAVDAPGNLAMTLECELPAYMHRKQQPLPVTGVMQIPMGSRVTVHATGSNKELTSVQINTMVGDRAQPERMLSAKDLSPDHRGFSLSFPSLMADTTLLFTMTDVDGIKNREPQRLMLTPTPDQPPQVAAQLDGIGTAVTPQARIAVTGQVTDDYGIGRVWFERVIDDHDPRDHLIAELPNSPVAFHLAGHALELKELALKPGQKILVYVKASDRCNLNGPANVSSGERWLLDVVTPERLHAILEARELMLRQHFELTMQEMTDGRDVLSRLGVELAPKRPDAAADEKADKDASKDADKKKKGNTKDATAAKSDVPKSEPGEEADSPAHRREMQILRVQSVLTNCQKGEPEVAGIAEGFEDLCKQHINNRIDTPELRKRLKDGIAEPLHEIAEKMYPELQRRLSDLQAAQQQWKELADKLPADELAKSSKATAALRKTAAACSAAERQTEEIILAMQKVRSQMLDMEQFNELVEMLRSIVESQQKLHSETQQRQKDKIRSLLKDD